ncbi:hypothetical protein AFLA_002360 [Aspergillus flavus NRRL3357]|nr:hypothetical protein AFLA_002360 [Aspergillus flavus NRRL3357]
MVHPACVVVYDIFFAFLKGKPVGGRKTTRLHHDYPNAPRNDVAAARNIFWSAEVQSNIDLTRRKPLH